MTPEQTKELKAILLLLAEAEARVQILLTPGLQEIIEELGSDEGSTQRHPKTTQPEVEREDATELLNTLAIGGCNDRF